MSSDYNVVVGFGFRLDPLPPRDFCQILSLPEPDDDIYVSWDDVAEAFDEKYPLLTLEVCGGDSDLFVFTESPSPMQFLLRDDPEFSKTIRELPENEALDSLREVALMLGYEDNACGLQIAMVLNY